MPKASERHEEMRLAVISAMRHFEDVPAVEQLAALMQGYTRPKDELVGSSGIAEIHRRQEAAKLARGKLKRSARAAANALAKAGGGTIILSHIHPRWLREAVTARLDAGEDVTGADVQAMRDRGPR